MRTKFKNCGPSAESAKFWCVTFTVFHLSFYNWHVETAYIVVDIVKEQIIPVYKYTLVNNYHGPISGSYFQFKSSLCKVLCNAFIFFKKQSCVWVVASPRAAVSSLLTHPPADSCLETIFSCSDFEWSCSSKCVSCSSRLALILGFWVTVSSCRCRVSAWCSLCVWREITRVLLYHNKIDSTGNIWRIPHCRVLKLAIDKLYCGMSASSLNEAMTLQQYTHNTVTDTILTM